jgi:hypothetical protein
MSAAGTRELQKAPDNQARRPSRLRESGRRENPLHTGEWFLAFRST